MFTSDKQLQTLRQAKYINGTFHIVRKPFTQQMSIHAYVKSGSHIKQVPLHFALMSRHKKEDYRAVRKSVMCFLPENQLKSITIEFKAAMWKAAHHVFPDVKVYGCVFHWSQAVWGCIQWQGLASAYHKDHSTHKYLRKLMALPFVPAEYIPAVFNKLCKDAVTPLLQQVCDYTETRWISSNMWPMALWSTLMRSTQTNNDIEGWYRWLNQHAKKGQLQLYLLEELLSQEAMTTEVEVRLVSEKKLKQKQKKKGISGLAGSGFWYLGGLHASAMAPKCKFLHVFACHNNHYHKPI